MDTIADRLRQVSKSTLSTLCLHEIVASVGVVLSLVFAGIQLNEGNRETRAVTVQTKNGVGHLAVKVKILNFSI